jgi:hypothetical protein
MSPRGPRIRSPALLRATTRVASLLRGLRCGRRRTLLERLDAGRNRNPGHLRSRPNMTVDREPARIVECSRGYGAGPWPELGRVAHRRAALRTESHLQPAAALIGAVRVLGEVPRDLHGLPGKRYEHRESAREPAPAEFAMAYRRDDRLAAHSVANRAARATSLMYLVHDASRALTMKGARSCRSRGNSWIAITRLARCRRHAQTRPSCRLYPSRRWPRSRCS